MATYILAEGRSDAILVHDIVADLSNPSVELGYGNGYSPTFSMAQKLLATKGEPLLLVADADTTDSVRAHERELDIRFLFGSVAGQTPYRVVLALPTLEIILVEQPVVLAALLGCNLAEATDLSVSERAVREPRRLLLDRLGEAALEPDALAERLRALSPDERTALRSGPTAQRIRQAVLELLPQPQPA